MSSTARQRLRVVVPAILVIVLAACSSPAADPVEEALVPQGTEAWMGTATPSDARSAPADPTAQNPVLPGTADPTATAVEPVDPPSDPAGAAPADTGTAPLTGAPAEVLAAMTLEQKVGQLFTVSLVGADATAPSQAARSANASLFDGAQTPAEVVQAYHLGGVAYLDHDLGAGTSNVDDVAGVAALSAGLQQAAAADTGVGLLIGADQEGGPVVRLRAPATVFPAARRIGDTGDLALAQQVGQVIGTEARAVGINWVFAPVADVNVNPDNPVIGERAFGTEAGRVVQFVRASAAGLIAAAVLPTLKHFPGHGDTTIDSHNSLPTIDHDLATLSAVDLPPFELASTMPTSVMIGHLAVPALDPSGTPATLSAPILDVLRGRLGFDGLVVTDAMNMGALTGFGDAGSLAVQAIAAGNDVVLMPTDLPMAYAAVLQAAQDGTLPLARLDQAVGRILQAKDALGILDASRVPPGDPGLLGAPAHQAVREDVRAACGC